MPKTKLDKPPQPIDWMLAAMLERKQALGITSNDLAKAANVSDGYIRKLMTSKHTDDWPPDIRKAVCKILGISVKTTLIVTEDRNEIRIS